MQPLMMPLENGTANGSPPAPAVAPDMDDDGFEPL
jgi:hypothetical protein